MRSLFTSPFASVTRIHSVREHVAAWRAENLRVGFVSTMGNIHRGHTSLVELALARTDRVVVSVFVNPLQFGPNEDFDRYPRTLEHDTEALTKAGAHLLFAPTAFEMYPMGFERATRVDVPEISTILCGQFRPGHFQGLATVLTKFFSILQPDVSVFGEKDYQQLVIVRRLVLDLCMPIEIISAPTVREHDGLACSTRNRYLQTRERNLASRLHDALKNARKRIQEGERDFLAVQEAGMRELERGGFQSDYFAVRQTSDLAPARDDSRDLVILAAARLGASRLIDNLRVQLVPRY